MSKLVRLHTIATPVLTRSRVRKLNFQLLMTLAFSLEVLRLATKLSYITFAWLYSEQLLKALSVAILLHVIF
jgi:hypothetical protein